MRVLFALLHIGYYRHFEATIKALRDAGAEVHLVASRSHHSITADDYDDVEFSIRPLKYRDERAAILRRRVERDLLFYAGGDFENAGFLRDRFVRKHRTIVPQKDLDSELARLAAMSPARRKLSEFRHSLVERRTEPHPGAMKTIRSTRPDVVVVSPVLHFLTPELEYIKAARSLGIPSLFPVASWDNTTCKGRLKAMPDKIAAWNAAMAEELVRLHGVPRRRIVITGAPALDWWLHASPQMSRSEFLQSVGLSDRPERKIVAYLCSTNSIGGGNKRVVVEDWLAALRRHGDETLRDAHVVIRPHPVSATDWSGLDHPGAAIHPARGVKYPTTAEQQKTYLETLHHADAVVGLNTSAMIESAIAGKPVLTYRGHASDLNQASNLHFRHLAESGYVKVLPNLPDHLDELAVALRTAFDRRPAERFLREFIRPSGTDLAPSVILANHILGMAR
ncbi:MAG: hypothetical protein WAU86_23795 [Oricola sp.]